MDPAVTDDPTPSPRDLSILVADIVASTSLYERLGDVDAQRLIGTAIDMMTDSVVAFGGRLVKSMGDGILASFEKPQATLAAREMLRRVSARGLELRAGVHEGPVLCEDGDVFGDVVNTAARLASSARPSEVLISRATWNTLDPATQGVCRSLPAIWVKGKRAPIEVFSILEKPKGAEITLLSSTLLASQPGLRTRVEVISENSTYVVGHADELSIGRSESCTIRVQHDKTSRVHARISFVDPEFVLVDSSTNGTYVQQADGSKALVRRREMILLGSGRIYPGCTPGHEDAIWLEFRVH